MKVKLNVKEAGAPVTSQKTGKRFFVARAESKDPESSWGSCRWTIMADQPFPAGEAEFVVSLYDAMKGTGNARPL